MTASGVARMGRQLAEAQMTSTCRINEKGTTESTDPDTGEVVIPDGPLIYQGKCKYRAENGQPSDIDTGGAEGVSYDCVVSVPFAVTGVQPGHRVTMLTSPDPDVVGMVVEVRKPHRHDFASARRLFCEEVQ